MSTLSYDHTSVSSRQRQSKKDEAIRKKVEQELSKKRNNSTRIRRSKKIAGTVSALRPAQALTVKENILVIEAAQLMAAKRGDCVLVVDDEEHLCGIFTAKDLAYRMVAGELDARTTTVSAIMTKNPMCVTADTSAQGALNLMVSKGFRHLPVCNEEGDIFGLLDITKCLYEALNKMERAYGSSRKLYDALEGVEREWNNGGIGQLEQYMDALRDKMSCPDLTTVLDHSSPVQVQIKMSVRDVAKLMKTHHTTAVLVMDQNELVGIFTSKDIVLRVIAAGLSPQSCSVVRVMTPHPDTALPTTSILDALKKMHDGHYLNLPVLDEERVIIGLVDVLRLTYATLEQINSIEGNAGDGGKFWDSITGDHAESESAISDSLSQAANSHMFQSPSSTPNPDREHTTSPTHHGAVPSYANMNYPDITPADSASAANEEVHSTISSSHKDTFVFKFKYGSTSHRIRTDATSYHALVDTVRNKILNDHLSMSRSYVKIGESEPADWMSISYLDDEDDQVLMTCDSDLAESVHLARKLGRDRVHLVVHDAMLEEKKEAFLAETINIPTGPLGPVSSMHPPQLQPSVCVSPEPPMAGSFHSTNHHSNHSSGALSDDTDIDAPGRRVNRRHRRREEEKELEYNLPIPQEMLLPAAITFLGVVILGVFTVAKLTGPPSRY